MKKIVIIALVLFCALGVAYCQTLRTVKVTVVEEDGTPIKGAKVGIYFSGYHPHQTKKALGKTDDKGVFKASGKPLLRMVVRIEKEGYYLTKSGRLSRKKDHEVTYVLRKKKNPIPLYAKNLIIKLPVNNKKCSYDLKVADWLPPYGKGKVADLIFKGSKSIKSADEWKAQVEISFPNEKDGIQKDELFDPLSEYKSTRISPVKGYTASEKVVRQRNGELGYKGSTDVGRYLLRVRSKLNAEGKLEQCHYVKLSKAFKIYAGLQQPNLPPAVGFTYYFNPTPNDRNLEFDPEKNLFKKLKREEQVWEP